MCLFFRCTIINVEMRFAFTIRIGDELSRLMEHLLVLLDEFRQKLTEIILREAYNQECSNDNINGDTIRAVERPVEFLHAIIMQLSFFVANQCHLIVPRVNSLNRTFHLFLERFQRAVNVDHFRVMLWANPQNQSP